MSAKNSGKREKVLKIASGNRVDLPHMQSTLSPQGYGGLYNYAVHGGGDAPISMPGGDFTRLKEKADSFNNYFVGTSEKQQVPISSLAGNLGRGEEGGWETSRRGNENLATHNNFVGNGFDGSYLNATSAPSFDSPELLREPLGVAAAAGISAGGGTSRRRALQDIPLFTSQDPIMSGRIIPGNVEMDSRDRKKERLIDSLSNSDMITCLPGFKKRSTQFNPTPRKIWSDTEDKLLHRITQQGGSSNMMDYGSIPSSPIYLDGNGNPPGVSSPSPSSYARQTPASHSPFLNYKNDKFINDASREVRANLGGGETAAGCISASRNLNSFGGSNPIKFGGGNVSRNTNVKRNSPPCSPITRAKAAIGQAQDEILKINNTIEQEQDRRKPPGAWKNMGTPFFSESMGRSAQRQQKAQYRMDLERQILAGKMRKAEQERKEKDGTDHPLGPQYAHPALTYFNSPRKHFKDPTASTTTAALTKYMKEKYALVDPFPSSHNSSVASSPRYPQESGINGSPVAGRVLPTTVASLQQQVKMEKVFGERGVGGGGGGNLIKPGGGALRVGDQNQGSSNPRFPRQQDQPQPQQQTFKQGNTLGMQFNPAQVQQQHQSPNPRLPLQYGYPAAVIQQHPQRQTYGYGMNTAWPMYQHPAYAQYYGQFAYGGNAPGAAVSQQQQQAIAQYYQNQQQQQNYCPSSAAEASSLPSPSSTSPLPHLLDDLQLNSEFSYGATGGGDDTDVDFEALKEKVYKAQKIWQTSDELPDPGLRTAVYKVELRKQIDADRKRKAERVAREKLEEDRIDRKIKEFQDEERRRMAIEERTRAELEELELRKSKPEHKHKRKNEAFTISQNSGRVKPDINTRRRHRQQRSRSCSPVRNKAAVAARNKRNNMGEGDIETEIFKQEAFNDNFFEMMREGELEGLDMGQDEFPFDDENNESYVPQDQNQQSLLTPRKYSPPVPVVQRKLLMMSQKQNGNSAPGGSQINHGPGSGNFFGQLKERLKSEKDLVERRLKEKVESTHKNLNLLKYTLNHN